MQKKYVFSFFGGRFQDKADLKTDKNQTQMVKPRPMTDCAKSFKSDPAQSEEQSREVSGQNCAMRRNIFLFNSVVNQQIWFHLSSGYQSLLAI